MKSEKKKLADMWKTMYEDIFRKFRFIKQISATKKEEKERIESSEKIQLKKDKARD